VIAVHPTSRLRAVSLLLKICGKKTENKATQVSSRVLASLKSESAILYDYLVKTIFINFITGVKGAQVEEIYDLSKPFKGCVQY